MNEIGNIPEHLDSKTESFSSLEIKECRKDTIKLLIEFELGRLNDELGHEIKPGENIWRIIYNHAIENGKTPIMANRLQDIKISPGDKIYFTKDYVYVKFLKGGYKIISFDDNDCIQNQQPSKTSKPQEILQLKSETPVEKKILEEKQKTPENISFQTIFDKDSPILGDQIAYKNEVETRKLYGKNITTLINTFCKGSVIDESFLYGVIARESRFDKNARSHTGVRGLGQITMDTAESIVALNTAKVKNDPKNAALHITDSLKNKNGELIRSKVLHPLNQLKLTISYLLHLESLFQDIGDNNFKTELIITSYNLGPGKTQNILGKYKHVKDWSGLKLALREEARKGKISQGKFKEITEYVPAVIENIKIASL
ncbi:MAG: transglycosylase SLT domain-containing protein [Candidatus Altimarinota bacterium]